MSFQLVAGRFVDYMSSVADGEIDPVMGTYPGIENPRWFDPSHFPVCAELEKRFNTVADEFREISAEAFFPDSERDAVPRYGDWRILPVYAMGHKYGGTARFLPTIVDIVENLGAMTTLGGAVFVSRLPAGASVGSHRGPTNTRARCHLGLKIPSGDCGIEVDGERRVWTEGQCLMLNDHLTHRVWNNTEEERIVLVLDVWHPDLTATERKLLAGLHVYASVQACAISKWQADFRDMRATPAPAWSALLSRA
jgi:aspartate beta-hydroxylase